MVQNLTKQELKKFDGKNGKPIYVAYNNKVYDVTKSPLWKNGIHRTMHLNGAYYTNDILHSPHGDEVFKRFPFVCELIEEQNFNNIKNIQKKFLGIFEFKGIIDRKSHRISSHFPIALFVYANILILLYLFTGNKHYDISIYNALLFGVITSPVTILSGIWSWKMSYLGIMTETFKTKIILSIVMMTVAIFSVILRSLKPEILANDSFLSIIYIISILILMPIVVALGHYGGKITFLRVF